MRERQDFIYIKKKESMTNNNQRKTTQKTQKTKMSTKDLIKIQLNSDESGKSANHVPHLILCFTQSYCQSPVAFDVKKKRYDSEGMRIRHANRSRDICRADITE